MENKRIEELEILAADASDAAWAEASVLIPRSPAATNVEASVLTLCGLVAAANAAWAVYAAAANTTPGELDEDDIPTVEYELTDEDKIRLGMKPEEDTNPDPDFF